MTEEQITLLLKLLKEINEKLNSQEKDINDLYSRYMKLDKKVESLEFELLKYKP